MVSTDDSLREGAKEHRKEVKQNVSVETEKQKQQEQGNTFEAKPGMICQHFKGGFYIVEGVVINSETQEKMVLYRALNKEGKRYVRPYEMFVSKVDKEKYPEAEQEYRFEPIFQIDQTKEVSQKEITETIAGLLAHIDRMETRMTRMRNKINNVEKDVKVLTNTRKAKKDKESLLNH